MSSPYLAEFLVEGVVMLMVASVGVVLNIISIFYFAQLKQQKTFHQLLLILAIVDTFHLLFSSLTFSIPWLSKSYSNNLWMYLVPYTLPLAQTSMTASVYMTISLTMERFFSVVFPFKHFRNRWMKSSFLLSAPSLLFSLVFTLPNYLMLRTVLEENLTLVNEESDFWIEHGVHPDFEQVAQLSEDNPVLIWKTENNLTLQFHHESSCHLGKSNSSSIHLRVVNSSFYILEDPSLKPAIAFASFREDPVYVNVYVLWLNLLVNTILPLAVLVILNTAIYRRLNMMSSEAPDPQDRKGRHMIRNQPLRRSTERNLRKREQRLARISLLIVLVFLVCHTVKNIPSMFELFGKDAREVPVCSQLLLVGHLLLTINSSVNFLLYSLGNCRKIIRIIPRLVRQRKRETQRFISSDPSSVITQTSDKDEGHAGQGNEETEYSEEGSQTHRKDDSISLNFTASDNFQESLIISI